MHPSLNSGEPLRFDAFMEWALYGEPSGFYASGRGAGRRAGDFLTSVEAGPLFGRLVARLADRCWEELGRPSEFVLVDAGAGRGMLARSVLAARPRCAVAGALRYVLVERSAALRRQHEQLLDQPPGPCAAFESRADLPDGPLDGVVIANELLDNIPCRLLERTPDGWAEVCVSTCRNPAVPASSPRCCARSPRTCRTAADALAPGAPVGGRLPLAVEASDWVGRALAHCCAGGASWWSTTPTPAPPWRPGRPGRVGTHLPRRCAGPRAAPGCRELRHHRRGALGSDPGRVPRGQGLRPGILPALARYRGSRGRGTCAVAGPGRCRGPPGPRGPQPGVRGGGSVRCVRPRRLHRDDVAPLRPGTSGD